MLIYRLRDIYREITGHIEPAASLTTVVSPCPAANADNITQSDMQARRQRRQRRADRNELRDAKGWNIRSW